VIKGNGVGKNNNVVNLQEPTDPQPSRNNTYRSNPESINSAVSVSIFNSASLLLDPKTGKSSDPLLYAFSSGTSTGLTHPSKRVRVKEYGERHEGPWILLHLYYFFRKKKKVIKAVKVYIV
jgi:hypothetical protein